MQQPSLFAPLSVLQNITFSLPRQQRHIEHPRVKELLQLLDLDTLLQQRIADLSGGEQQRVALARSLVSEPKLLLLDEPLSAISNDKKAPILRYLWLVHQHFEVPMIYVTHQPDEWLKIAHRVINMHNGKVIADTPISQAFTTSTSSVFGIQPRTIIETNVWRVEAHQLLVKIADIPVYVTITEPYNPTNSPLMSQGDTIRVQILATHVNVFTSKPEPSTYLNQASAVITAIEAFNSNMQLLTLHLTQKAQTQAILALVHNASVTALALTTGQPVYIQFNTQLLMHKA